MNTREILVAARELISEPERWTQGEHARDLNGRRVSPGGPNAVCWCSLGALEKVADGSPPHVAHAVLQYAVRTRVSQFNDGTDHAAVLAMFDRAIAYCEGGENG